MKYYSGEKPCPACGISGKEKPRFSGANGLCRDCEDLIRCGKIEKTRSEKEIGKYILLRYNPYRLNRLTYCVPSKNGDNRYSTAVPYYISGIKMETSSEKVNDCLVAMLKTLDNGDISALTDHELIFKDSHYGRFIHIPFDFGVKFFEFYKQLCIYMDEIAKMEFDRGKQLLVNLNSGKITLDELEQN